MNDARSDLVVAAQAEADRRHPMNHIVDDPFGETGEAHSDPYGYEETANRAFVACAEWLAAQPEPQPTREALDRDTVAKVLCRLEGRRTGRSLDEVVAPGLELWTRYRYEAEQLIAELRPLLSPTVEGEPNARFAELAQQTAWSRDDDDDDEDEAESVEGEVEWEYGIQAGLSCEPVKGEPSEEQRTKAREKGWQILRRTPGVKPGLWEVTP